MNVALSDSHKNRRFPAASEKVNKNAPLMERGINRKFFFKLGWQTEVPQRMYNEDHPSHSNYRMGKRLCDLSHIFQQGMTISEE